ncbi:MAG: sporulation protein YunB [Oscillospiraceae bacterium]|nr:sporulation protein YunB [Oscillospiraceae bacterium]
MRSCHRRFRPGRSRRHPMLVNVLIGMGLAALAVWWLNRSISPVLRSYAAANLETRITRIVNDVVARDIESGSVDYDAVVTFVTDDSGQLTGLKSNLGVANSLRANIVDQLTERLQAEQSTVIGIPVGNLTGISLLSSKGFEIPVTVLSVSSIDAAFASQFTEAGLNQTRYVLYLNVTVTLKLLLPGGTQSVPVEVSVMVADAVLLGQVPESYTVFNGTDTAEEAADNYFNYG